MSTSKAKESVWDYPRPPRVEPVGEQVRIELGGKTIARSDRAVRVLETASPPQVYLPPEDIGEGVLEPVSGHTVCEWKGQASYADVVAGGRRLERGAWFYPSPNPRYSELAGWVSFYPGRVDGAYIGEEKVRPQAGNFYGGWITDNLVGPFKGEPGTEGW
jgi:uncharacterized protein (DUF427 family)